MVALPRGIRNNNPGNIDKGQKWQGLAVLQPDSRFCTFVSPEYGIRAICKVIQTYNKKYKIITLRAILNRYAPTVENDTAAYVAAVAKATGFNPDEPYPIMSRKPMAELVKAIIKHENGIQPYTDSVILSGVDLGLK